MKKINMYTLLPVMMLISITCLACGTGNGDDDKNPANEEFPIPWPEGGEMITDGREDEGTTGFVSLRYDNDMYGDVVEFYDDYADGSGWNRSETGQGEMATINYMNLMSGLNISVDPPDDQIQGAFIITLTVS